MVYLPWLTTRGGSAQGPEQIVRHFLFLVFKLLTPFASDCLEQILNQFSQAVLLVANDDQPPHESILLYALRDLAQLEARPLRMAETAYEWCSAIHRNRESFEHWESLLLTCLEVGFRHLDPWQPSVDITLTQTEHHRELVDVVFRSRKSETIADLLQAWTLNRSFSGPEDALVDTCAKRLVALHDLAPFSPRLRRLVIRFVEIAGYLGFEGAGVEKLTELLDHLLVIVEDVDRKNKWVSLLLDVIRSSEGTQRLSHRYWDLLVELAILDPLCSEFGNTDGPAIAKSLIETQEWDKLECWIVIGWALSKRPDNGGMTEEDLERSMVLLFRQRPDAAQKLQQWMETWSQQHVARIPEPFERACKRAHEAAQ